MSTSTARQTFRETVAAVAEKARAKLPQNVNGRIESAMKLVLMHDVMPLNDGSTLVASSTDAMKSYLLTGRSCECQDFTRGQAPDGWCQHRIAAGIHKRVQEMAAQSPAVETQTTPAPDGVKMLEPTPPALPEAGSSLTLKGKMAGVDALLTVRGMTSTEFKANLESIRGLLDPVAPTAPPAANQPQSQLTPQQHNAAAMHQRVSDFCHVHNVPMKENVKDGRRWFSHRLPEGQWCQGK